METLPRTCCLNNGDGDYFQEPNQLYDDTSIACKIEQLTFRKLEPISINVSSLILFQNV